MLFHRSNKMITPDEFASDMKSFTQLRDFWADSATSEFRCKTAVYDEDGVFIIDQGIRADVTMEVVPDRSRLVFLHTISGATSLSFKRSAVTQRAGQALSYRDGAPYTLTAGEQGQRLLVAIDDYRLRSVLKEHYDLKASPLFEKQYEFSNGGAKSFYCMARATLCAAQTASPVARKRYVDTLLITALDGLPNSLQGVALSSSMDIGPDSLKAAVEVMRASALENLSILEIAERVGVSARALQHSFLRHVGQAPVAVYRGIRLKEAVAELSRGEANAPEIAAKWGFTNYSRFSVLCRREFGKRPQDFKTIDKSWFDSTDR